jgi:hypothetical protein
MTRQEAAQLAMWELIEDIVADWAARDRQEVYAIRKPRMAELERLLDEASDWTEAGA